MASLGRHALAITNFTYDGLGPAAFLVAGVAGRPGPAGTILIPEVVGGPTTTTRTTFPFYHPRAPRLHRPFTALWHIGGVALKPATLIFSL